MRFIKFLKVSKFSQWNPDGLRGESRKHYVHTFRLSTYLEVYWRTLLPHLAGQGVKQFNRSLYQKAHQQTTYLMISCSIIPTIQWWDITEQFTKWAKHLSVVKQLYHLGVEEGRKKKKRWRKWWPFQQFWWWLWLFHLFATLMVFFQHTVP